MNKTLSYQFSMIHSLESGLALVVIPDAYQLPHVRQAFEHAISENSDDLGFPLEGRSLLSLYSGSDRQLEQALALRAANGPLKKGMKHNFEAVGTRVGFDWLGDPGFHAFKTILEASDEDWITLELEVAGPISPAMTDIQSRMRHAAKQAGARVMIFLVCAEGYETTGLHYFCDDFIEVAPCEPDPGYLIAFSIDCVSLRHLNVLGHGKKMCSVKVLDGKFHRRYAPFIAPDLETRVMWILRGQGKTLDEIGRLLKVDKSTVLRRLKGLPEPRLVGLDKNWLKRCLALLPNADADALDGDEQSEDDPDWP